MPFRNALVDRLFAALSWVRRYTAEERRWTVREHAMIALIWTYQSRLMARLDTLLSAWKAGTLRPLVKRAPRKPKYGPPPPPPDIRLPRGRNWLMRFAPGTGRARCLIDNIVADPEVQALIAAEPARALRIIRPLADMIGIDNWQNLPPRAPRKPRPPKPRKPQEPELPGYRSDLPLKWQTRIPGINAPRLKIRDR